jgi:outer membrane protein assembly factor BamB
MNRGINILVLGICLSVLCSACDKNIQDSTTKNDPADTFNWKLDTLWSVKLGENHSYINQNLIETPQGLIFIGIQGNQAIVKYFDKEYGQTKWNWMPNESGLSNSQVLDNKLICQNTTDIYSLNIQEGNLLFHYKETKNRSANTYGQILGKHFYCTIRNSTQDTSWLIRSDLNILQTWDTVYILSRGIETGNSRPNIQSYNLWLPPDTHDSILIFQHRMSSPNRVDVVAWNMTHQRIEWIHEDLTQDGNSNHQQIFLHDNKAYFGGSLTYYCFDMFTGNILWSYDHPDQTTSFSILKTIYAESVDAIIVKAVSLFAFDPITGAIKWINHNAGISSGSSASPVYHDEVIYYTADSKLWAVRARNGVVLWSESSARIPMGESTFRGAVTIDPDRRVLYATSRDRLFAIRLYED